MLIVTDFVPTPLSKRILDVVVALVGLVLLFPFLLVFFLLLAIERMIHTEARGRWFYCEERMSGSKAFKFCKIRTCWPKVYEAEMKQEGFIETVRIESKPENLTPVGKLLKKVYLDESPQLWNVLKGDMSIVGPRPPNCKDYKIQLAEGIFVKKAMRGGLTGLFQSYKGHFNEIKDAWNLDEQYIDFCRAHNSWQILLMDLKIIGRTFKVVWEHKGV